jgi:hypothetical protein
MPSIVWMRSKEVEDNSYQRLNASYSESLKWTARRDTLVTGFLWFREYDGKDFTLKVKWKVTEQETSEEIVITRTDSDRDMAHPWKVHFIDLGAFGVAPIPVDFGKSIEFSVKNDAGNQFTYLHSGYANSYKTIEGQEHDWTPGYSHQFGSYHTGGDYGQYPGILYVPLGDGPQEPPSERRNDYDSESE